MIRKYTKIKEVKKELKEYKQTKPRKLEFFEIDDQNKEKYSNTIELYDQMPKYYYGGVIRKLDQYLDVLQRKFKHHKQEYELAISPAALVDKDGKTIFYYPSQREELVEDALRRIAAAKGNGVYLDDDAAVKFTLYELEQELEKMGHGYNVTEIKEAIEICNRTIIEITSKDGNEVSMTSPIFPFVGMETSEKIKGGKNKVVVMFHPLVTRSIDRNNYRLINYEKVMSYKMNLSRWLHKRISHNFTQAATGNSYAIKMTSLIRDSGMKGYARNSDSLKQIRACLDEMKRLNSLSGYKIEREMTGRKIVDATLILNVSDDFASEIRKANKAKNDAILYLNSEEYAQNISKIGDELEEPVFGLTRVVVLNILGRIKTKEDCEIAIAALQAAKEYIMAKPDSIPMAITKTALKEGWKPKEVKKKIESKLSLEEQAEIEEKRRREEENKIEAHKMLQENPNWRKLKMSIKKEFSEEHWSKWLSHLELVKPEPEKNRITLGAPDKLIRDWIIREFIESNHRGKVNCLGKSGKTLMGVLGVKSAAVVFVEPKN